MFRGHMRVYIGQYGNVRVVSDGPDRAGCAISKNLSLLTYESLVSK